MTWYTLLQTRANEEIVVQWHGDSITISEWAPFHGPQVNGTPVFLLR